MAPLECRGFGATGSSQAALTHAPAEAAGADACFIRRPQQTQVRRHRHPQGVQTRRTMEQPAKAKLFQNEGRRNAKRFRTPKCPRLTKLLRTTNRLLKPRLLKAARLKPALLPNAAPLPMPGPRLLNVAGLPQSWSLLRRIMPAH